MHIGWFPSALWCASVAILLPGVSHAQITLAQACKMHTPGVVVSMKKAVEFKQPVAVATQSAGFVPGGPRHRMAELAYRMFSAGNPERLVAERVEALCHSFGAAAVMADEPTFGSGGGRGAQLCSDVAGSTADALDGPERNQPFDMAFTAFLSGHEPEDGLDAVKAAFAVGYRVAQRGGDKRAVARAVMDHCEALDSVASARLGRQFYAR